VVCVGLRAWPQIDDHIEHSAADAPHELCLARRRSLEMNAAHSTRRRLQETLACTMRTGAPIAAN